MKYEFRGRLKSGKSVDIFNFDGEIAKCDHGDNDIHIDEFNAIFLSVSQFKKFIGIKDEDISRDEPIELEQKKSVKKSK